MKSITATQDMSIIVEELLEQGMDPNEIQNFLTSSKVVKVVQLPSNRLAKAVQEISKIGQFAGPGRMSFFVAKNRQERIMELIQNLYPEDPMVRGEDFSYKSLDELLTKAQTGLDATENAVRKRH